MNRVALAVDRVKAAAEERGLSSEELAKLDGEMAVSFEEHFRYQQSQAEAHASGKLSTDEAQIVYVALGEVGSSKNGGWAAGTDVFTKVAVTMLMGELLAARVR